MKINIAVISDLHIGSGSRASDFSPVASEANGIDENYKDTFLEFLISNSIEADILLVPGDLTHTGKHSEAVFGINLIKEIAGILGVNEDCIFLIPGNHDVDWHIMSNIPQEEFVHKKAYRYFGMTNAIKILPEKSGIDGAKIYESPFYNIWETDDLIVLALNSTYDDFPETTPHYGRIDRSAIEQIREELTVMETSNKLKICLTHHHPIAYSDAIPHLDFSIMVDAEILFDLLFEFGFDFLVHGHKHIPKFQTHKRDSSKTLNILCSGSFSAFLDTKLSGYVNNQFHLIEVHEKSSSSDFKGHIKSWAFLSHDGWVNSSPTLGIDHILPFGNEVHPEKLKVLLEKEIGVYFKTKDMIKLSDIEAKHSFLRYLPKRTLMDTLKSLEPAMAFEIHESGNKVFILKS